MATDTTSKNTIVDVPMKVATRNLLRGDRVTSGEVVIKVDVFPNQTRKGYRHVYLAYPGNETGRWSEWNANTLINITRKCVRTAE